MAPYVQLPSDGFFNNNNHGNNNTAGNSGKFTNSNSPSSPASPRARVSDTDTPVKYNNTYSTATTSSSSTSGGHHYFASSAFIINLISALPIDTICEVMFLVMGIESNYELFLAALRTPRFLLLVNLISFLNQSTALRWSARFNPNVLRIFNTFLFIFLLVHWIGCGWFMITHVYGFGVDEFVAGREFEHASLGNQYLYAAFWALCRITDSPSGTGAAQNNAERIFQMVVSVAGISTYMSIVGNVAHLLTAASSGNTAHMQMMNKMEELNNFIRQWSIPEPLQVKVKEAFTAQWEHSQLLKDYELVNELPDRLKRQVIAHMNNELLRQVKELESCTVKFVNILSENMKPVKIEQGTLLQQGDLLQLFVIKHGTLVKKYTSSNSKQKEQLYGDNDLIVITSTGKAQGDITFMAETTACEVLELQNVKELMKNDEFAAAMQALLQSAM